MKLGKKFGLGIVVASCLLLAACGKSASSSAGNLADKQVINWDEPY
jgi:oligopeptide transport system substrate-binding protein